MVLDTKWLVLDTKWLVLDTKWLLHTERMAVLC